MSDSESHPPDELGLERLQQRPAINLMDPERLALIRATIADKCTDAEIGHFLELCAHYELDPFAREAWIAKSNTGKLLIMVGRDGLRKVAQRNGLHVDGDVVHEKDEIAVVRTPDGNRTIAHSYGNPTARGPVIGAWAEVREGGPLGRPMGYFYAPLDEYRPTNVSEHSPWSKQLGVMILAAAERQAIRQATPLSGLLAVGEDEVVRDNEGAGRTVDGSLESGAGEFAAWTDEEAEHVRALMMALPVSVEVRMRALAALREAERVSPGSFPALRVEMMFTGLAPEQVLPEVERIEYGIEARRQDEGEVVDAVVVTDGEPEGEPEAPAEPVTAAVPEPEPETAKGEAKPEDAAEAPAGEPGDPLDEADESELVDWRTTLDEQLADTALPEDQRGQLVAELDRVNATLARRRAADLEAAGQERLL